MLGRENDKNPADRPLKETTDVLSSIGADITEAI